jgi:redox-sensing transcriptional repressor
MPTIPDKAVARLALYRHILANLRSEGLRFVYSHELAEQARASAAQVRRDLMAIPTSGSASKGYDVQGLIDAIGRVLDAPGGEGAALVGVGNLGQAILSYFNGRRPKLSIVAAFDWDPQKTNRTIHGCLCYPMAALPEVARKLGIGVGVVSVPAKAAQQVTDQMVAAGLRGILNFAPARLRVPAGVVVEDIDFGMSLERVAYRARQKGRRPTAARSKT